MALRGLRRLEVGRWRVVNGDSAGRSHSVHECCSGRKTNNNSKRYAIRPLTWQLIEYRTFHQSSQRRPAALSNPWCWRTAVPSCLPRSWPTCAIATNAASSSPRRGECMLIVFGPTCSELETSDGDKINAFQSEMEIAFKIKLQWASKRYGTAL